MPQQCPSNVFNKWISSYQHRPPYQQLQQQQHRQQQHPYSQIPQCIERSQTSFQQQFQQFSPNFQVPFQHTFQTPFQHVYRPQNRIVHPLQQQPYVFNFIFI